MEHTVNYYTDEGNSSSSAAKKKRVYINISKRIKDVYEEYSQKDGYNTVSEALRAGIKSWIEGSLKFRSNIDEKTKIKEIFGDRIVELNGTYDTEIKLEENLLQRFDKYRLQQGFKSRSYVLREIMHHQILGWKQKYDAIPGTDKINSIIALNPEDVKKLRQQLENLKQDYGHGYELNVLWLPKANSPLDGEVAGNKIYIYSQTYEEAEKTLWHEYIEYLIKGPFSYLYADVMNVFIRLSNKRIYEMQEKIIDALVEKLKNK